LSDVRIDWRVLLFAVGLCFVSSVGFGLAPAFQTSRVNLSDALKQAGARGPCSADNPDRCAASWW